MLLLFSLLAVAGAHRPLKPVGGNTAYMEHLASSGLITKGYIHESSQDPVDPWKAATLKGASYIPSTAPNSIFHFHNYSSTLTRTELSYAATGFINHIKLTLHWVNWFVEKTVFLANLEDTIATAHSLNMSVSFALFEGPGDDLGPDAPSVLTGGGYLTRGWISSPGFSQMKNTTLLPILDRYVTALTSVYGKDPRVVGWDVLFQPNLCGTDPSCPTLSFLTRYLNLVNQGVSASNAWVTVSVIPGAGACDTKDLPPGRTLVAYENLNGNPGAVGGDGASVLACAQSLQPSAPLPVVLTASMGRAEQPPSDVCEILFEAYGTAFDPLGIPHHARIGVIIPSLMIGVNSFTSPPQYNQGLIWPNGTWYSDRERLCFSHAIPPFPPPPPGPPPPAVNFTTPDGLSVGLRNTTRAVQVLGLVNDNRWFGNFSFVPPLWNYIPSKPHRDGCGFHHLGDATFRVQPASETNASSWAFYSTSQLCDSNPAHPITPTNPALVYDAVDLTHGVGSGGMDTRYPLGLSVFRSVEKAPGGLPGFAIRWNLSVPTNANEGVRVGGLGFTMISDTFFGGTNNTAIAATGSFLDAHVGLASGFATATRADGSSTLLVTPCSGGDSGGLRAGMEAWRPILEDPNQPNEGMWEWSVHTAAWNSEWSVNAQAPELTFPNDPDHQKAWPHPLSPWPSWHLHETVHLPNPRQWNPPTSVVINPGEMVDYALCFTLAEGAVAAAAAGGGSSSSSAAATTTATTFAPVSATATPNTGPRARDAALAAVGRVVLLSVPGYVLGGDMGGGALFVTPPPGVSITNVTLDDPQRLTLGTPTPAQDGSIRYPLIPAPNAHGRARVALTLSTGEVASIHYFILPPLSTLGDLYGTFAESTTWLPRDLPDSFGRSASFMPWDREDGVHVLQDGRPFVVGLSDDAGAGANLGMASKLSMAPVASQVALLDMYVRDTLLGTKPDTATPPLFALQDPETWRILMTVWYFDKQPDNSTDYYQETDKCHIGPSWCAFNSPWCNPEWCAVAPGSWEPASYRQYNFPHQIATYLSLYLTARNFPLIPTMQPWSFYLNASVQSILKVNCWDGTRPQCLCTVGLMDGTVFREVLRALRSEGPGGVWEGYANIVEDLQRNRTLGDKAIGWEGWNSMDNPAGSEFAWDTTGQEEVAIWGAWFNASDDGWMHGELSGRTVESILGYMGVSPTWAYHGAAYGMGDFSNNAKWMVTGGWEREGGHYRAGLNSIPVIERYRLHPNDFHLLLVGVGGIMAPLPNINEEGAPSMAFHTHPFIMEHDPNSGDHGLGFFGSTLNAGSYLHNHTTLGPLCFMCDITSPPPNATAAITLVPRDMYHRRAFLEPIGLWIVSEAGRFVSITLDTAAQTVTVEMESVNDAGEGAGMPGKAPFTSFRLRVEGSAPVDRPFKFVWKAPSDGQVVRGAYSFAPNPSPTETTKAVIGFAAL